MTAVAVSRRVPHTNDLAWLLWRRHRVAIVSSLLATAALAAGLVRAWLRLRGSATCDWYDSAPSTGASCSEVAGGRALTAEYWLVATTVAPVLFGVLVAAPLFPREYEQQTYVLTAVSSLPRSRWLWTQLLAFVTWFSLLFAALVPATIPLRRALLLTGPVSDADNGWNWVVWSSGPLLVPYAVFACAAGLLAGALLRRTLPALVVAAVVIAALRVGGVALMRPRWEPPVQITFGYDSRFPTTPDDALIRQSNGGADVRGRPVAIPGRCWPVGDDSVRDYRACLASVGITQRYISYQPGSRIRPFQAAEGGTYLVLSVLALLGTARLMRRDPPAA